ncbi:hypothetical protein GDO86_017005, partial [Hymenochirus boettgeri]
SSNAEHLFSTSTKSHSEDLNLNHEETVPLALKDSSISAFMKKDQSFGDENYPHLDVSSEMPNCFVPNRLNLSNFRKVLTRLKELHPNFNRDEIIEAMKDLRESRGGYLSGLSNGCIIAKVSTILRNKAKDL